MLNAKCISSVLKPMFYSTKIIGFAPFNVNEKSFAYSILDLLWSISIMIFLVGISFFSLTNREVNSAIITKITDYLHTRLCVASLCGGIFFACINRKQITEVIRDMAMFDKDLKLLQFKFSIEEKYRKNKIYLITSTILLWVYISALFAVDIAAFTKKTLVSVGQMFAYAGPMLTTFIELQFCTLVLLLKERFSWLNNKMVEIGNDVTKDVKINNKSLVPSSKIYPAYMQRASMQSDKEKAITLLQEIGIFHHRLCTISYRLNKAYSFQILLIVVQAFMTVIAVSFYLAKLSFSNTLKSMAVMSQIYYFNTLILHLLVIVVMAVICSDTAKEAQKSGIYLHDVVSLNISLNEGYLDLGITCFSLQLLHHNVKFTACKLFDIDETLLYSIAGAATTYLVIVLQFEFGVGLGKQNNQSFNNTIKIGH